MKKKLLLLGVVFVVGVLCISPALAFDPFGAPRASLQKGQWSTGVEYAQTQTSLRRVAFSGDERDEFFRGLDLRMNKYYLNIGRGITDDWDGFVRVGYGTADYSRPGGYGQWSGDADAVIYGLGTKVTIWQQAPDLVWGAIASVSKNEFHGDRQRPESGDERGEFDLEFYEWQIAFGPTWDVDENVSIYGGGFFHDLSGWLFRWHDYMHGAPLDERSQFGAFAGVEVQLSENTSCNVEYMLDGDSDVIAGGIVCRF